MTKKPVPALILSLSLLAAPWATSKDVQREKLLGNILKQHLESYHFRKMKIDDGVSKRAFEELLEKLDYGKQFLTRGDVRRLRAFEDEMDDNMVSGEHALIDTIMDVFSRRVAEAETFRGEIFKKPFVFTRAESLELDPDKRKWARSPAELRERWRKTFKYYTMTNYLTLVEAQKEAQEEAEEKPKEKKGERLTEKEMMDKAHEAISQRYEYFFKRLGRDKRIDYLEQFFNSIAGVYDPHTSYLPPKKKEDFDMDISGTLEGIGALLQEDGPHIKVVQIVTGGAAWRQKELEVDDVILAVGEGSRPPVSIVDMGVDDAIRYIRGKKNTEVRLTVKKADGTRKVVSIVRDVIQIGATYAKSSVLTRKGLGVKVGYIHLPKFYRDFKGGPNCTEDVRQELRRLKAQKVDAVILDLRNNGGGALEDAKLMTGLFIREGPVVQVKNHTQKVDVLRDTDRKIEYDGPLVVMTNRFSASASEILAAAIHDYKRGPVVGGRYTHGKGTVQVVIDLNQGPFLALVNEPLGALKVTIQKFYRVNGVSTQYSGVTPDIVLPDPLGHLESREQDLDNSLRWDKIEPRRYRTWNRFSFALDELKRKSRTRVRSNENMQKIVQSVEYLTKRKNDTMVSLNLEKTLEEERVNEEATAKYKIDHVDTDIVVTHYEPSLKAHEKIRKEDEKKWQEDFKRRKEEWVEGIQKDILLGETLFIARDHVAQVRAAQRLGKL